MLDKLIDLIISLWNRVNPFIIVYEYEWVVLLRAGKVKKVLNTELHFRLLKLICLEDIHLCSKKPDTYKLSGINITTTDNKTALIGAVVEYVIKDPIKWLIENSTAEGNFHDIAWGTCGELLTTVEWDELKQKSTRTKTKNKLAAECEHLGVEIMSVSFGDIVLNRVYSLFKDGY